MRQLKGSSQKEKKEKKIRRKKGIVTDLLLPPMARSIFHHVIA
jgi:hypothetical protein